MILSFHRTKSRYSANSSVCLILSSAAVFPLNFSSMVVSPSSSRIVVEPTGHYTASHALTGAPCRGKIAGTRINPINDITRLKPLPNLTLQRT